MTANATRCATRFRRYQSTSDDDADEDDPHDYPLVVGEIGEVLDVPADAEFTPEHFRGHEGQKGAGGSQ